MHFPAVCQGCGDWSRTGFITGESRWEHGTRRQSAGRLRSGCSFVSILPASCERTSVPGEEQTWKSFWVFTYCKEIAAVSKGKHVKANNPRGIAIGSQQKNASESNVTDNPTSAGGVGLRRRHGFVSTSAWAILASWQTGLWAAPGPRAFATAKFLRPLLPLFFPGLSLLRVGLWVPAGSEHRRSFLPRK